MTSNNQAYSGIIQAYSGIFRALCNPSIFITLVYSELWHIQITFMLKTLTYSGPEANSEPCQTSTMERFTPEVSILCKKVWTLRGAVNFDIP